MNIKFTPNNRRSKARIILLLAFACLAAFITSCSSAEEAPKAAETSAETPAETQKTADTATPAKKTTTVTDLAGRQVELELPIEKAVIGWTGSGGPFMTMSALLEDEIADHVAGWDNGLINNRADMYEAYVSHVPGLADIPVVGSPHKDDFNFELVVSLEPDAIIFPLGLQESTESTVASKLEDAGIPIVYMDYHAETIENHTASTMLLGELFGEEERAAQLVERYTSSISDISQRVVTAIENGKTPPRVYFEVGYKGPNERGNSYGRGFMWGALMELAGANNITADSFAKAEPAAPEFVLDADPEVIVISGSYWPKQPDALFMGFQSDNSDTQKGLTAFSQRPGWEELSAIKNTRLHGIHHGLGRELYDYTSVIALAKSFYPEEFADLDPTAELKAYYDDFLPYDLKGTWFTQWEG